MPRNPDPSPPVAESRRATPSAAAPFILALTLIAGGLAGAIATIPAGCGAECRTDIDCRSDGGGYRACQSGMCVALDPDLGAPCDADEDCESETGVMQCVDGNCAARPRCQTVDGSFRYVANCTSAGDRAGAVSAATADCTVELAFDDLPEPGDGATVVLDIGVDVTDGATVTSSSCAGGTWSAAASAATLTGCDLTGAGGADTCEIVLRLAELDGDVCSTAFGSCAEGACEAISLIAPGGVCQ